LYLTPDSILRENVCHQVLTSTVSNGNEWTGVKMAKTGVDNHSHRSVIGNVRNITAARKL
jgi:hypothetical protein